MSLDLLAVQDQIVTQLETMAQDVYVTAVPDDSKVQHGAGGLFLPYVVVLFADMKEAASGNGITSVRHNPGISYCVVETYAPTERAARQVSNIVRDKLTGFKPTDAGELRLAGGKTYSTVAYNSVPKKYVSEVAFTFIVNTVVS
jgi:hypothetical protein